MSHQDEFFSGLKDEDDKTSEFFAGAEHLVRMKKQHGLTPPEDPEPLEKVALFGLSQKEKAEAEYLRQHNGWADEMNKPENLDLFNQHLEVNALKLHKKPLAQLNDQEWEAVHAATSEHPHFKTMHQKHFGGGEAVKQANFEEEHGEVVPEEPPPPPKRKGRHSMGYNPSPEAAKRLEEAKKKIEKTAGVPLPGGLTQLAPQAIEKLKKALQEKEKKAAPTNMEALKSPKSWPLMAAMGLAMGGATYLGSRPKKELNGKSENEVTFEKKVEADKERVNPGLLRKLQSAFHENERGTAQAFREHPVKATGIGAAIGTMTGLQLARLTGSKGLK